MARYKEYSYDQGKLIPISFHQQIAPGTFEFALNDIVDNVLDLSIFEKRFSNDETGAPAYDPRVMLKIVLYAFEQSDKGPSESFTKRMITKYDSALGRFIYSRRMGTVEPVFANICRTLGLDRITMRGRIKADTQWKNDFN